MEFNYNNSKRHHYLPQFYLKGFLNDKNTFAIYDKKREVLKKGEYSPESHFFESHRNTISILGDKTDFIETVLYSKIDDDLAPFFQKLRSLDQNFLSFENLFPIKMFISFLYWRLPVNDKLISDQIQDLTLEQLGLVSKNENLTVEELNNGWNTLKGMPFFEKILPLILPYETFKISPHKGEELYWKGIFDFGDKTITSDNPIILKDPNQYYEKSQIIIVPISKNKRVVYGSFSNHVKLTGEFNLLCDLVIIDQAHNYVCCSNKDYLIDLIKLHTEYCRMNKMEQVKKELFDFFIE